MAELACVAAVSLYRPFQTFRRRNLYVLFNLRHDDHAGSQFLYRCGASLKERTETRHEDRRAHGFLIAITLIAIVGLGIMLGGALTLKRDAALGEDVVGMFMFFTFFILLRSYEFCDNCLAKKNSVTHRMKKVKNMNMPTTSSPRAASRLA